MSLGQSPWQLINLHPPMKTIRYKLHKKQGLEATRHKVCADTHLFPIPAACSSKKMICDRGMAMQHSYRRQDRVVIGFRVIGQICEHQHQFCLTWFLTSLQINRWVLNKATPTSSLAWNSKKRKTTRYCLFILRSYAPLTTTMIYSFLSFQRLCLCTRP